MEDKNLNEEMKTKIYRIQEDLPAEAVEDTPKKEAGIGRAAIVIGVSILVLAVAAFIFVVSLFVPKNNAEGPSDTTDTTAVVTTERTEETDTPIPDTTYADHASDPENAELKKEDGATVDAEDIAVETGFSKGIDVSKWQGRIDWTAVKASGMDFAYIRIGYRGENGKIVKDESADYNLQKADDAGLLLGVYFFSTATTEAEAEEEARWTLSQIAGYPISYPVVYDCEGFRSEGSRMYLVSREQRTKNARAFLKTVTFAGYEAMLYGASDELSDTSCWDVAAIEKDFKVWVAHYPAVTYPVVKQPDYAGRCDAWQYTNKGRVDGVSGNADMVVCYFERERAEAVSPSKRPADATAPLTEEERIYKPSGDTVTAKEVTNLRSAPTTKSDVVGVLRNGEKITRSAIGTNGWSKLLYNGQTVYAITSYLTTDLTVQTAPPVDQDVVLGQVFSPLKDTVTAKELVNLRAEPTTESELLGTLEKGEFLERLAVSDKGWSRLSFEGQDVYAFSDYLIKKELFEADTTALDTGEPDIQDFSDVSDRVTAKSATNLRDAPSTETGAIVYTLKAGEYIERTGVSDSGWSRLDYNGTVVFAVTSYLTTDEMDEEGFWKVSELVTAKSATNIRTAPSLDESDIVYTLKNGEYLERIGVRQDGWSKLVYKDQVVYAVSDYLTEKDSSEE